MPQVLGKRQSPDATEADLDVPTTPTESPTRKRRKITQNQKQALIDNLQLEITERARHLRSHYALQASDLRSRIERRINRIPISLRQANMGELFARYEESVGTAQISTKNSPVRPTHPSPVRKHHPLPPIPQHSSSKPSSAAPSPARNEHPSEAKQTIDEITVTSDKENAPIAESIPNPKNPRRAKTVTASTNDASRTKRLGTVLSPKSHNSRTMPRSPVKDGNQSPSKGASCFARPISPLKPASPLKTAASVATSAISASLHGMVEHAKRGTGRTASKEKAKVTFTTTSASAATKAMPPPPRPQLSDRALSQASNHSNASNTSASSNATTVITKAKTRPGKTTIAATTTQAKKPTGKSTASKASTKQTTTKKVITAEPAAGRRVLRKRN